jgi:hypothetical protein
MRSQASLHRQDEEEFMMSSNVERLDQHVAATLLGRVTP